MESPLTQADDLAAVQSHVRALLVASGWDDGAASEATVTATASGYTVSGLTRARAYLIARSVLAEGEGGSIASLSVAVTPTSVAVGVG